MQKCALYHEWQGYHTVLEAWHTAFLDTFWRGLRALSTLRFVFNGGSIQDAVWDSCHFTEVVHNSGGFPTLWHLNHLRNLVTMQRSGPYPASSMRLYALYELSTWFWGLLNKVQVGLHSRIGKFIVYEDIIISRKLAYVVLLTEGRFSVILISFPMVNSNHLKGQDYRWLTVSCHQTYNFIFLIVLFIFVFPMPGVW